MDDCVAVILSTIVSEQQVRYLDDLIRATMDMAFVTTAY